MNTQECRNCALELVACMRSLAGSGLSPGNSGNASARAPLGMLITPSGISPAAMNERQIVGMTLEGEVITGDVAPSSEWRMHAAIYVARPEAGAIVHCHSRHATALACCARDFRRVLFRSVDALHQRRACLLANHGQIAIGSTLENALALAREIEELAAQYLATLLIGGPVVLGQEEMSEVLARFKNYGQPRPPARENT